MAARRGRASLRYEPTDTLAFDVTYQALTQKIRAYYQYESANIVDPTQPASPVVIEADDRYGVADLPIRQRIEYDNLNYRAQWSFAGQRLNYAGAYNKRVAKSVSPVDDANFLDDNAPANVQNLSGPIDSRSTTQAHELRLSSEERLFGMFDYIVGAFYQDTESPTDIQRTTPVFIGPISPTATALVVNTPIGRRGETKEKSGFANLTWHVGDKTEISGGVRYIDYKSEAALIISGVVQDAATENYNDDTWIYTASIKHNFNDDLMVYASTGTSWRPGISAVGDFSLNKSERENSFLVLPPEESESYEIGIKASALDRHLQTSFAIFHQKFDNYPYRSSGPVFFKETAAGVPEPRVNTFNFVAAVPVEVNGVEGQVSFAATPQWDIAATAAYAKGKIKDGLIPCNDYFPHDGVPDSGSQVPTVQQIEALTGDNLAACVVSYRAANAPLFSGNVQSEYRIPISAGMDTYVRGLITYYGKSQNDPTNAVDDVSDYALMNLYLGVRDRQGAWEVTLYGKNITDTERVLRRDSTPATLPYSRVDVTPDGIVRSSPTGISTYRRIAFTEPREFGVSVRYAFGSR